MNILIAGAGKTTRELLARLGDAWSVTLVDTSQERLDLLQKTFRQVKKTHKGDASSLVVLTDASLTEHKFVAALTGRDEINVEVCRLSREKGIKNVVALANDSRNKKKFEDMDVKVISGGLLIAMEVQRYLENPRLFLTTIGEGKGEIMEVEVSRNAPVVGKRIRDIGAKDWLIGAIFRDGELIIPHGDTEIRSADRVTIVGHTELYQAIFHLFKLDQPKFPLMYGQNVLSCLEDPSEVNTIFKEALYLVKNTRANKVIILAREELGEETLEKVGEIDEGIEYEVRLVEKKVEDAVVAASSDESVGCVLIPPSGSGFLSQMFGREKVISLAHRLGAPLMIPKGSHPYERILVPYSPTKMSALALEMAHDIASQVGGTISVLVVSEPVFIRGEESERWVDEAMDHAREIARIYKIPIETIRVEGNRVKEVVRLAAEHDLLIIGSTTKETSFMKPHVGELMVQNSPCSVMVVAF